MAGETEHIVQVSGGSHALVSVKTTVRRAHAAGPRQAAFLAQLIATRDQLPQTRERRRADPAQATKAYGAAAALAGRSKA